MQDQKLFELFMAKKNDFDLCEKIEMLMQHRVQYAIGLENAKFYDVLRQLMNSINNAGWEERRSEQIKLIRESMDKIIDKYEDYLP
jgi:hypothetical protein